MVSTFAVRMIIKIMFNELLEVCIAAPQAQRRTMTAPISETTMERTAGSNSSWGFLVGLTALVALPPIACNDVNNPGTSPVFDDTAAAATASDLLAAVGPQVILPALSDFAAEVDALEVALTAWQDAVDDGEGAEALIDAQAQWLSTMAAWEMLEIMQIGPAGSSLTAVAGEDLRDEIYSWPTINPCRIDQETAYEQWSSASFFTENLVNSYGLDALEHTLFAGLDNTCPGQVDINADGTWDSLGDFGVQANRAAFSLALTSHISAQTSTLITRWSEDGDNFSAQLALAVDSPYASEQEALNAVFDALFYLETVTKDQKLATPLGYVDCGDTLCPDEVEGLVSGSGAAAIAANLAGFRMLFTGGEGIGFDDLLTDLGHGDLATQILTDLDTAESTATSITMPLDEAVIDQTADVEALYNDVKTVTDALKGDLATILVLTIPSEAAGDND